MRSCCSIEMLGTLRVVQPQRTLTRFGTQKAGVLLALLALRVGRTASREELIDLLWCDMDLPAGRNNLSTTLSALRRLLEPPGVPRGGVLIADRVGTSLNPDTVVTDIARFEHLLRQAREAGSSPDAVELWGQAVGLYRGDFLPGCYLDWAVQESGRLQILYVGALKLWTQGLEDAGTSGDALGADPYSEEAGGALIRLLARTGHLNAAREAYRELERTMRDEFGTSPSPETRRLVEGMLSQPNGLRSATASPSQDQQTREADSVPLFTKEAAPYPAALPASFSRFFGREAELALLTLLVLPANPLEERTRLVMLTGPGGIGKTRIATEFARQAAVGGDLWVGFVPPADLSGADRVLPHIAHTLGLPPAPEATTLDCIVRFFTAQAGPIGRPLMLILDNLEQIPGACDAVRALLERIGSLTCLCTSRRRLGLRGERLIHSPHSRYQTTKTPFSGW